MVLGKGISKFVFIQRHGIALKGTIRHFKRNCAKLGTFEGLRLGLLDGLVDFVVVCQFGFGGFMLCLLLLQTLLDSFQFEGEINLLFALLL